MLGNLEFPKIRHCEALKKPKQSHLLSLERDCFGILNEIASVALLPRNDGDFRIPKKILKFCQNSQKIR